MTHRLRKTFVIVVLPALVLFLATVSRPASKPLGRFHPPEKGLPLADTLTVLNLNMLHGYPDFAYLPQRLGLLRAALADLDPDIVLLQEAPWRPDLGYAAQTLAGEKYAWAYARANGNRYWLRFEEGSAILSRYLLEDVELYELHPQPRPWEHRIVLHALVRLPQGNLHLFVTHLTNRKADVNTTQAADLYRFVAATAGDEPALIAGDFNARPTSPTINQLSGWVDLFAQAHPAAAGYTCCAPSLTASDVTPEERIDYLFYRPGTVGPTLTAEEVTIIFDQPFVTSAGPLWLSDHFGLLARLRFNVP